MDFGICTGFHLIYLYKFLFSLQNVKYTNMYLLIFTFKSSKNLAIIKYFNGSTLKIRLSLGWVVLGEFSAGFLGGFTQKMCFGGICPGVSTLVFAVLSFAFVAYFPCVICVVFASFGDQALLCNLSVSVCNACRDKVTGVL